MKVMLPIIQSKLQIPVVKDEYIRRATLTKKMKQIPKFPLTILHSGAGYGKSTALALYMRDEKVRGCWYSISAIDDDILPFLTYLIHSIRGAVPEFGKQLVSYMESADMYIRDEEINLLCSLFINEVLAVPARIILVLDDFHQIEHSNMINSWMEKLIAHLPANLHIVISSRRVPGWKQLAKLKVCGQLLEISRDDLVLTIEEMDLLLNDFYDLKIDPPNLQTIFHMTEGWIIALCMIAQQIPSKRDISALFEYSSHSLQDLFQYLVMEVFSKQPPKIKQFLEQTAIFEEMEEELLNEVLGIDEVSKLLEQLKKRNLFLQTAGHGHYRYHALFKEFLEKQLLENQPDLFEKLHLKCAQYYEKREVWEKALFHYKKLNHFGASASILMQQGMKMVENGKLESVFENLKVIPELEIERFYHLWYLKAEIYRYRSLYQEAEECYQKAYTRAEENHDYLEMSRALEGKAQIYLDTIQPHKAEKFLYEAIVNREKSSERSGTEMGKLYLLLSENLLNSGKAIQAEKWLHKAKILLENSFDGNIEARFWLRTGRLGAAKEILKTGSRKGKVTHPSLLPQSHRETELLLALINVYSGDGQAAKELSQAGIQQGISLKAPMVEACAWIRMGHAVQLLNKYDLDLSKKCYDTALEIMDLMGVTRSKAEALMGLCILYGTKGEFERAMEAGSQALEETEKVSDVWLSGLITLCMGIASVYDEQFSKALQFVKKAEALFVNCSDRFGEMLSKFWSASVFYAEKKQELFLEAAGLFLQIVQVNGYEFFFYKRSLFGPRDLQAFIPFLLECTKTGAQKAYALKVLQEMGMSSFDTHPGYSIRVQTLGKFKIWLGEKEVREKAWQREKAKELFQLLITKNTPVQKDEITQILWPRQDKQSADRDFKVALNTLHHVLEPNRKPRAAPFFIIREGMFYGLNPFAVIDLDTVYFQECIQNGLKETNESEALSFLEKGLQLYHGEYLPDRRYDDWCAAKRESMQIYFLRGAEKKAKLHIRRQNYDQAIFWCERIIEHDRTWEEAYRLLMYSYFCKNNRPQAIKWFQKCKRVLEEELGVAPLEPTKKMYEMIIDSASVKGQVEQP